MIVAHKIALDPNHVQATYFRQAAGVARFAYNWGLARWRQQYAAWQSDPMVPKPSNAALRRELNAIKAEQFPWMLLVTKNAPQMALIHLGEAFKNFFDGRAERPTFKKRGRHDRFSLTNDQFVIRGRKIRIPKLGWVRMHEALRWVGKILAATISRTADRWFVSITVEMPDPPAIRPENQRVVGVDLGISALATLSTGENRRPQSLCRRAPKAPPLIAAVQSPDRSGQSPRRAQARRCHSERDTHFLVEEYAENPTPHRPTPCPDREYPGGCVTPIDHRPGRAL